MALLKYFNSTYTVNLRKRPPYLFLSSCPLLIWTDSVAKSREQLCSSFNASLPGIVRNLCHLTRPKLPLFWWAEQRHLNLHHRPCWRKSNARCSQSDQDSHNGNLNNWFVKLQIHRSSGEIQVLSKPNYVPRIYAQCEFSHTPRAAVHPSQSQSNSLQLWTEAIESVDLPSTHYCNSAYHTTNKLYIHGGASICDDDGDVVVQIVP